MRISDWSSDVCSSDLADDPDHQGGVNGCQQQGPAGVVNDDAAEFQAQAGHGDDPDDNACPSAGGSNIQHAHRASRSEEHTSELPSLMRISYAVFCLKKKNQKTNT